jgi:hypothetical protein
MSRIKGIEPNEAGPLTRTLYWFVRRKLRSLTGKDTIGEPTKIMGHHLRLFRAMGGMEMGQAAAHSVPDTLKNLAGLKAATLIGCPF